MLLSIKQASCDGKVLKDRNQLIYLKWWEFQRFTHCSHYEKPLVKNLSGSENLFRNKIFYLKIKIFVESPISFSDWKLF